MAKNYSQPKMVNWYRPRMLLNIGLKAVISGTFGNYADRRELEAALKKNDNEKEWDALKQEYCSGQEIWIDVVNDTGDGFNSTFAIAKTVAQEVLELKYTNKNGQEQKPKTERGKILIFGGDEVYPFPTLDEYKNRFFIPFASASSDPNELTKEHGRPHLYAIPGNHDWYDGLGNFIKLFCQQRRIGIWSTKQHRSYFVLPLPNRYWLWAIDIQLNSDIDGPQLNYFKAIAKNKMLEGDKVILLTAEPAWVYKQIHRDDHSFDKLRFFIDSYIHNKNECTGKKFKLAATLTGDLHHYSRYCCADRLHGHQYITAGGGGAFLHLTHNLPKTLKAIREGDIDQQKIFPSKEKATKLLLGNFIFPFKNMFFTFLLFCVYLFLFWLIRDTYPRQIYRQQGSFFDFYQSATINPTGTFRSYLYYIWSTIFDNPGIMVLTLILGLGFYLFTDTNVSAYAEARIVGIMHAVLQVAILFAFMYFLDRLIIFGPIQTHSLLLKGVIVAFSCGIGSIVSGLLFGIYLFSSNRLFDMHINEASSSLASQNYKNFLRLHVHEKGVTIYPIGIEKVPTNWKHEYNEKEDRYYFKGNSITSFLIENPIEIADDKL